MKNKNLSILKNSKVLKKTTELSDKKLRTAVSCRRKNAITKSIATVLSAIFAFSPSYATNLKSNPQASTRLKSGIKTAAKVGAGVAAGTLGTLGAVGLYKIISNAVHSDIKENLREQIKIFESQCGGNVFRVSPKLIRRTDPESLSKLLNDINKMFDYNQDLLERIAYYHGKTKTHFTLSFDSTTSDYYTHYYATKVGIGFSVTDTYHNINCKLDNLTSELKRLFPDL